MQLYLGLRLGEVQGLRWEDVDLDTGRLYVRRVYVRKTRLFRDYPKGGKHRIHSLPCELWKRLKLESEQAKHALVMTSPLGSVLPYRCYLERLSAYCEELGLPKIGTHGFRHSTSELYLSHGATRDEVRELLGRASSETTERHMHGNPHPRVEA